MVLRKSYKVYPYSSYHHIVDRDGTKWLESEKALGEFAGLEEYKKFVEDYIPYKNELKDLSEILANSRELGL